jgi:predicted acetyltransferase
VDGPRGTEGYVAWTLEQVEAHAATALVVREMAATTEAAERSLWGLVGLQRHQVASVHADVSDDDPLDRALVDADRARAGDGDLEHFVGDVASGPMIRLTDPALALAARGWPVDGRVVLGLGDRELEVRVSAGTVSVTDSDHVPDVVLDAGALAAVAFGALPLAHASRLGWASTRDDGALEHAAAMLALPPYFSPDPF